MKEIHKAEEVAKTLGLDLNSEHQKDLTSLIVEDGDRIIANIINLCLEAAVVAADALTAIPREAWQRAAYEAQLVAEKEPTANNKGTASILLANAAFVVAMVSICLSQKNDPANVSMWNNPNITEGAKQLRQKLGLPEKPDYGSQRT